ncbi:MAG: pathogenicity locus [Elusimicrobia bacterium]|nr:pathogenicity locus [Elusimicrobiota bacterium]
MNKTGVLEALQEIPGVGKSVAEDLWKLGIKKTGDLRGQNPQRLYERHCRQKRQIVDRCMLYVLRCAVYYASAKNPNPELFQWWRWSDENMRRRKNPLALF